MFPRRVSHLLFPCLVFLLIVLCVGGYHADDHSCSWVYNAAQWHWLRHAAHRHISGETPWKLGKEPFDPMSGISNCPFGVHVWQLLKVDAAAEAATMTIAQSKVAGFGLYLRTPLPDVILSGWPAMGLFRRLCEERTAAVLGGEKCGSRPSEASPAAARAIVAVHQARGYISSNASSARDPSRAIVLLRQVALALKKAHNYWLGLWHTAETASASLHAAKTGEPAIVISRFLALDLERPCCQFWHQLAALEQELSSLFELRCLSSHRNVDGQACPACRLSAQGLWFEEAFDARQRLRAMEGWGDPHLSLPTPGTQRRASTSKPKAAFATILTCEDVRSGLGFNEQRLKSEEEQLEQQAVLLAYIDALRTLAYSAQQSSLEDLGEPLPFIVLVSLKSGAELPPEPLRLLKALGASGLIQLRFLPPAPLHLKARSWGKAMLWDLSEFTQILYVDADALVVDSVHDLFQYEGYQDASLEQLQGKPGITFAASLTRSMTSLNAGIMLLRPDPRVRQAMLDSFQDRESWVGVSRWSGQSWNATESSTDGTSGTKKKFRSVLEDQDHLNEFVATHFTYQGELDLTSGTPQGLDAEWLLSYSEMLLQGGLWKPTLGAYFTLPIAYNFCATSACLTQYSEMRPPLRSAVVRQITSAASYRQTHDTPQKFGGLLSRRLGAKILHWPGDLRKPWQRCHPAARSPLDAEWWEVFHKACSIAPPDAKCNLSC